MPSVGETRKELIDPRLRANGWRVVPYARWLAGDRTPADAVEEHPTDSGPGDYPPELSAHALSTYDLMPCVSGTTRFRLTQGRARVIPVPRPSLGEQRRIVAKVQALIAHADAIEQAAASAIRAAASVDQSVLARGFRGEL